MKKMALNAKSSTVTSDASVKEPLNDLGISEGYYTKAQAKRGEAYFYGSCAVCHTADPNSPNGNVDGSLRMGMLAGKNHSRSLFVGEAAVSRLFDHQRRRGACRADRAESPGAARAQRSEDRERQARHRPARDVDSSVHAVRAGGKACDRSPAASVPAVTRRSAAARKDHRRSASRRGAQYASKGEACKGHRRRPAA